MAEDWRTARLTWSFRPQRGRPHRAVSASVLRRCCLRHIIVVDDGSTDRTIELAEMFCKFHHFNLVAIPKPIGKTPTIKRQARELDSDVQFISTRTRLELGQLHRTNGPGSCTRALGSPAHAGRMPLRKKD